MRMKLYKTPIKNSLTNIIHKRIGVPFFGSPGSLDTANTVTACVCQLGYA
jgi:hypothetical protein